MTFDRRLDKEGTQNFREKTKKKERITFERELVVFIK